MSNLVERLRKKDREYYDARGVPFQRQLLLKAADRIEELEAPGLPDDVARQVELLRKQCIWQRSQGTSRDNGYPYHKHQPDCDICRSADLLERQARNYESACRLMEMKDDDRDKLQQKIEELKTYKLMANQLTEAMGRWGWEHCADGPDLITQIESELKCIEQLESAIRHLNDDPHVISPRPCATCRRLSKLIGEPFGCDKLH